MFDDRLATVLRTRAASATGERTQFGQLLDLLGTARSDSEQGEMVDTAYARLAELSAKIPAEDQSRILREAGLRIRNPRLVTLLAQGEPKTAASAMATARLADSDWEAIIPALPVTARGFLRHRRDLPPGAIQTLKRLGVGDLTLPDPHPRVELAEELLAEADPEITVREVEPPEIEMAPPPLESIPEFAPEQVTAPEPKPQPTPEPISQRQPVPAPEPVARPAPAASRAFTEPGPISAILERIEQYRVGRRMPVLAPRLPLGDADLAETPARIESFDVVTDATGRAITASDAVGPWITGMLLTAPRPGPLVRFGDKVSSALRHHQPVLSAPLHITGAPVISGEWRIDASPIFQQPRGGFAGYRCRLRRPVKAKAAAPQQDSHSDKMRQILHELRTPVGAIQGFAEIIQQQLFGPAPHEYRAHAAAISVDAARLLAGFDEMERLARLESEHGTLTAGEADIRAVIVDTLRRLDGVLRPRNAGFDLDVTGDNFLVAMSREEALGLVWRVLATIAGALGPGEKIALQLEGTGSQIGLACTLPTPLQETELSAERTTTRRPVVSAGMFGPRFAFRLARAEVEAAGGTMLTRGEHLTLTLPVLTDAVRAHSTEIEQARG